MCQDEKTTVNLRIEGKTETIFEGPVSTCGHRNPCAGPTCTTALDDANKAARFGFDGTFDEKFDDFFITSIGDETPKGKDFWFICLNFLPTEVGGCQQKVKKDDQVLFAYATQDVTKHYLKLSGPNIATIHFPVVLTVTDGTGALIPKASVDGHLTDDHGRVSLVFDRVGTQKLKATRQPDSVRSNEHTILVIVGP
ncbi:hypothetical protein BGY98DRAFT_994269 [Russula aff. rugulosa BPL654]|nr:hypothetical protein BGY98DRAFT_994269 [Russula aff. rugulosa BPL654]